MIEKKSRFIGYVYGVANLKEFQHHHDVLKKKYGDANHITFSYRILVDGQLRARFFDDGEPSGTAGKPIYNHLEGKDLINTVVFVVRYFGGIKLGAGGLVRAYGGTAKLAMQACTFSLYVEYDLHKVTLEYSEQKNFERQVKALEGRVISSEYAEKMTFEVEIPKANSKQFCTDFKV
jgi:uncharacterized YigZ family protein